jgi:hypothetical protein
MGRGIWTRTKQSLGAYRLGQRSGLLARWQAGGLCIGRQDYQSLGCRPSDHDPESLCQYPHS